MFSDEEELDHDKLISAVRTTFDYRGTEFDMDSILEGIEDIRADDGFRRRWGTYCRKNAYVDKIDFDEMLNERRDNVKVLSMHSTYLADMLQNNNQKDSR